MLTAKRMTTLKGFSKLLNLFSDSHSSQSDRFPVVRRPSHAAVVSADAAGGDRHRDGAKVQPNRILCPHPELRIRFHRKLQVR